MVLGFITTKPIVDNSDPFTALAFRFFFVAVGFYFFSVYSKNSIIINRTNLFQSVLSGVLFHGLYLGGVFFSISVGMPTSTAALIVTLQPILTNILSGPLLNEVVTISQWVGAFLGFFGAVLFWFRYRFKYTSIRFISNFGCINFYYILYHLAKKISNNLPLSVSNFIAVGGCLFHCLT